MSGYRELKSGLNLLCEVRSILTERLQVHGLR